MKLKKQVLFLTIFAICSLAFFSFHHSVFAQVPVERHIDCDLVDNVLQYPVCAFKELATLTSFILVWTILGTGLGCLGMFIYGAYLYIMAREDPRQAEQGRLAMLWSAIGAFMAASLFIFLRLLGTFVNVPIFVTEPSRVYAQEQNRIELVQVAGEVRSIRTNDLLKGTSVTLYWFSPEGWIEWPAQEYENQRNPYTVDVFGRYRFLVPPGSYYITADKSGYVTEQTDILVVEKDMPIIQNISMEEGQLIWAYLLAAGWVVFIAAAAYIIVVRIFVWRKKQSLRTHLLEEIRNDSPEKLAEEHGTD